MGAGASHTATAAEPTAAEPAVAAAASAPRRAHIRPVARMDASMARDRKLRGVLEAASKPTFALEGW